MLLVMFFLAILLVPTHRVRAQEVSLPFDSSVTNTEYRRLLELYRTQADLFAVALGQYQTLRTLASQEEAVQSMRSVLLTRAEILTLYFEILARQLQHSPGVSLDRSSSLISDVNIMIGELKAHRSRIQIAVDRLRVDQEGAYLIKLEPQLLYLADRSTSLLRIAVVQDALDTLNSTTTSAREHLSAQPTSDAERIEQQRGFDEIERTASSIRETIENSFIEYDRASDNRSNQISGQIQSTLSAGYRSLTQGLSYIEEIIK